MASSAEPVVRDAEHGDVAAICRFGEAHIRPHYAPLIGADGFALGTLGFGRTRFQLDGSALLRGVRDVRLGCLGTRHFLGGGDLLLGHIGQAVDVFQAFLFRSGGVRGVERLGGLDDLFRHHPGAIGERRLEVDRVLRVGEELLIGYNLNCVDAKKFLS